VFPEIYLRIIEGLSAGGNLQDRTTGNDVRISHSLERGIHSADARRLAIWRNEFRVPIQQNSNHPEVCKMQTSLAEITGHSPLTDSAAGGSLLLSQT
jgi:hypothetical protein